MARQLPGPAEVVGRVAARPRCGFGRVVLVVEVEQVRVRGVRSDAIGRIEVSLRAGDRDETPPPPAARGDRVRVRGVLRRPRDFATAGVASHVAALRRRGIRARLHVDGPERIDHLERVEGGTLAAVRLRLQRAIERHVVRVGDRRSERVAAVLNGLVLGDRAAIEPRDRDGLARAGLIHLLAISGLHVGMVGGLVRAGGRAVGVGEGGAALIGLGAAWSYVLLAGAPPSAVRAAVVGSVIAAGEVLHRDGDPLNTLALAFLVCSLFEPGGLRSAGFQLTFVAAAGLTLVAPRLSGDGAGRLRRALAVSAGAQLAVLPVVVNHFGRVAWGGVVLNLVGVPLATVGLMSGLCLGALDAVGERPGALAGAICRVSIDLLLRIGEPELVPWSFRVAAGRPLRGLLFGLCLALALRRGRWARPGRVLPVVAAGLLLAPAPTAPAAAIGAARLHVLDVGQGDAILLERADGSAWLVDAGGFPGSNFDVGDRVVVPYLLAQGRRRIDVAVMSHTHPDHAAGLYAVVRDLAVGELWLPVGEDGPLVQRLLRLARRRGTRVVRVGRGDGRGDVRVLHPSRRSRAAGLLANDASVVVGVGRGGAGLVLTGDIHAAAERELLGTLGGYGGGVLKVAHHGSRTSSGNAFLAAVRPRLALISCGPGNPFGHPHPEVVDRLRRMGAAVRRTDRDGTIVVRVGHDGRLSVLTARARFAGER